MSLYKMRTGLLLPFLLALLVVPVMGSSSDLGHLSGIVKDRSGKPLANLVVALVAQAGGEMLPVFTRTDPSGRLQFTNIESGLYELQVKSSAYQSPQGRVVEIPAGRTASVSLVLHQLLSLGPDDRENVGIKTLLRSAADKRVIFRTQENFPGSEGRSRSLFEAASFEIYSNAGLGNADHSGGSTTNFAFRESLGTANHVVAGQVASSADTSWRVKNLLTYDFGDDHSLQLLMGYGRINNGHPNIATLEAPFAGNQPYYPSAAGAANILSLGMQDRLTFGDLLSLNLGFELNKVRGGIEQTIVSPNAELTLQPFDSTSLQARVTSKRETLGDTIDLPDGERVNLTDAVSLSMLDGHPTELARARFWEASLTQQVSAATELQLAAFRNQFFGASIPFFALVGGPAPEFFKLSNSVSENSGYRLTLKQKFGENFKASLSYVNATAEGLDSPGPSLLVERGVLETLIRRQGFHALAAQLDAVIPATSTKLTALLKAVPGGHPITSLDAISDFYQTGNKGISLYVRQVVPVPVSWLEFLGLDFLQDYKFEALLDVRNLTNEEFGIIRTAQGNLVLVQNPRTFRGGIAVNF